MDRVAVVTGAGRGIGQELARGLAARGYAVLATDVEEQNARETAERIGGKAWSMRVDVRDPDAHRAAAAAASERGRIEVWVNNAGVLRTDKAWVHSDDEVRLITDVNLLGVIWGSRAAVEAMRGYDGASAGHIINLASLSALSPVPGLAVYSASKHGVLGFTAALQGDLDEEGIPIRVHAVCPAGVDTGMVRERDDDDPDAAIIWSVPMLPPEEVAERALKLLDSRRIVMTIPPAWGFSRILGVAPRATLKLAGPSRWIGGLKRRRG